MTASVTVTDHSQFDYAVIQRAGKVVVDTRNAIAAPGPNVVRLGAPRVIAREEEEEALV